MNLSLTESARWCAMEWDAKPTPAKLRRAILRNEGVYTGFSTLEVPAAPRDQTVFKVCGNDRTLMVAVALFDAPPPRGSYTRMPPSTDEIEFYFDRRFDRLGYFRFGVGAQPQEAPTADAAELESPSGRGGSWRNKAPDIETARIDTTTFLPYPEAHSSAYPLLTAPRCRMWTEYFTTATYANWRCRWVFATFDTAEVFRFGDAVGFNICRYRPSILEYGGWNYPSGNGGPDATGFGTLYRHPPALQLGGVTARREGSMLQLAVGGAGANPSPPDMAKKIQWELLTPLGQSVKGVAQSQSGAWQCALPLKKWEAGRYRLRAQSDGKTVAGGEYHFDFVPAKSKRDFKIAMTYDPPMSMMANYYTPERLQAEMGVMKSWGVERVHWIDYSDTPAFWEVDLWGRHYRKTEKACGDFLTSAAAAAHANGQELIADFKIFDLGLNTYYSNEPCTVLEFDGRRTVAIPEIVAHPEWTMHSNPAWRREPALPVTRLRFYSREPLPDIDHAQISLLVSKDNRTYKRYTGPMRIRQGTLRRPHQRWTPAGNQPQEGAARNWFIELDGLKVTTAFAALQIGGADVTATHHGFMVVEATGADGSDVPLMLATTGHRDFQLDGYFFSKEWPGWNNYTEPIVRQRPWLLNNFGMCFSEAANLPTLLEPTYEGTRRIWLARIEKMLDAGVDGVCIRILNHHNGIASWLLYAFAPIVVAEFAARFGREPGTTPEDYEQVRRLRGEYLTQFLRDAKKLTAARGKKLMAQLESGVETPPHLDTRMQIFLDYATWLGEGILDEALMKDWTAQSPWVHENILPLARREGIPIHIISRCLSSGFDTWSMETTPQLITNAYRAGFSGFNFYETDNLIELNPEGVPMPKGIATPVFLKAARELGAVREGN